MKNSSFAGVLWGLTAAFAGASIAGCGQINLDRLPAESRPMVEASLTAGESAMRLDDVEVIEGVAVVTTYDDNQAGLVRAQRITVYPSSGDIEAVGRLPGGTWTADVGLRGGRVRTHDDAVLSDEQAEAIEQYLRLILHRLRGGINFLDGSERIASATDVFVTCRSLHRIVTTCRDELPCAYFFDKKARRLHMVTKGDYEIPGAGTVTLYGKPCSIDGVCLPTCLEVMEMGANSFFGSRKVLSVRFENLRVH